MIDYKGKFFGPNEIEKVEELEDKTYTGLGRVRVHFTNGTRLSMPVAVLENTATDLTIDLDQLRDKRVRPVVEQLLTVLAESELTKEDMMYAINTKLAMSLDDAKEAANKILWGGKETHEITLMDVENVFKNHGGQKESK